MAMEAVNSGLVAQVARLHKKNIALSEQLGVANAAYALLRKEHMQLQDSHRTMVAGGAPPATAVSIQIDKLTRENARVVVQQRAEARNHAAQVGVLKTEHAALVEHLDRERRDCAQLKTQYARLHTTHVSLVHSVNRLYTWCTAELGKLGHSALLKPRSSNPTTTMYNAANGLVATVYRYMHVAANQRRRLDSLVSQLRQQDDDDGEEIVCVSLQSSDEADESAMDGDYIDDVMFCSSSTTLYNVDA